MRTTFCLRYIVLFVALATLPMACAFTFHFACPGKNWRAIGYRAAMIGKPVDAFDTYVELCAESAPPPDRDAWTAGHAKGIREYCQADHAYDEGFDEMGAYFPEQCPKEMVAKVRAEYERGDRCGVLARRYETATSLSGPDDEDAIDALSSIIAEAIVGAIFDKDSEWARLGCHYP